ncbi:branched-chain amino acid ABC transporter permease [Mycobacterium sp. NPDC003449]
MIQLLIDAATLGSLYCLLAIGLSLVYGVIGIPHFAHAGVIATVALVAVYLQTRLGLPFVLVAIVVLITGGLLAVAVQRLAYAPIMRRNKGAAAGPAVALGVLMVLGSANLMIWGGQRQILSTPYSGANVAVFGNNVSGVRIAMIVWAVAAIAALQMFLKRTRTGRSIVAVSQDNDAARLMGVEVRVTYMAAFFISGLLAGAAALAYGGLAPAYPYMADTVILNAFVVVIIGGMGSIYGAIAGGFLVAFAQVLGTEFISSNYTPIYAFVVLLVVLTFKPSGLFGRQVRTA